MRNRFNKNYLLIYLAVLILAPSQIFAETINQNSTVTISAYVVAGPDNIDDGNGGRRQVGSKIVIPINNIETTVNFRGQAYPLSQVFVLKDGEIAGTTTADLDSNFLITLTGLKTDSYTFAIYSLDSKDRKSSSYSFPIFITSRTTVNISNIFLSPTINIDKQEVKRGENLFIFGQSRPESDITISVHSDPEYYYNVRSSKLGIYSYNLDTSILELGPHQTKSKAVKGKDSSLYNLPVSFIVGTVTKSKNNRACSSIYGDLNCDTLVNLVDFSIMVYWYKKYNPPIIVDLNHDGQINLSDFSIMAYNWTA